MKYIEVALKTSVLTGKTKNSPGRGEGVDIEKNL
jgi:hypothetical protein